MFIARPGPKTPSAVWGGMIKIFVTCEFNVAERGNAG